MGLGLGAALRFLVLCAAFLVALRAVFLAFPRAFFRATRSPPLRLTGSFLRLVGPLQQTSAGVLPQGQHSSRLRGTRHLRGGAPRRACTVQAQGLGNRAQQQAYAAVYRIEHGFPRCLKHHVLDRRNPKQ